MGSYSLGFYSLGYYRSQATSFVDRRAFIYDPIVWDPTDVELPVLEPAAHSSGILESGILQSGILQVSSYQFESPRAFIWDPPA